MGNDTLHNSFINFYKVNIFRPYYRINRFVSPKARVYAREVYTENFYKFIFHHSSGKNVAVTDKVCDKSVFRLIVNVFRSTNLLDIPLIHDNDCIRHG